jgi:hypothetical protein
VPANRLLLQPHQQDGKNTERAKADQKFLNVTINHGLASGKFEI